MCDKLSCKAKPNTGSQIQKNLFLNNIFYFTPLKIITQTKYNIKKTYT